MPGNSQCKYHCGGLGVGCKVTRHTPQQIDYRPALVLMCPCGKTRELTYRSLYEGRPVIHRSREVGCLAGYIDMITGRDK